MVNIIVNKVNIIEYKEENNRKFLNDIFIDSDIKRVGEDQYHILYKGKSYRAELIDSGDKKNKLLKVNGKLVTVEVKDQSELLLEKMGLSTISTNKIQEIKAPMPGLIIDIKVSEGDIVKMGDQLIVLEAMKMENSIKSPCDGIVQQIISKKGDTVEKNKILIRFAN